MELATLITETVKLSDDAHRANNAGHPEEAKGALNKLHDALQINFDVYRIEPEPEDEPAPEPPAAEHTTDGDS